MSLDVVPTGRLLARNTLLNLAGQGLPLIVAVVSMPFVVHGLGADRFGILAFAWVLLGYFGLFDLGLSRAATKYVSEALWRGGTEDISRIAWTALLVQLMLGLLGVAVVAALTPVIVHKLLHLPQTLVAPARSAFYLMALALPAVLVTGTLRGLLEASQRFVLVNSVRAPFAAANFALPLVGLLLGMDLPGIVALLVGARVLAALVHLGACLGALPWLRDVPRLDRAALRKLAEYGGWVTISSVVSPVLVYLDRFMIGALLSVAAVGYYVAPYEVISRLSIFPVSAVATLFPVFSALHSQRRLRTLGTLLVRSTRYLLMVVGPVALAVVILSSDILKLWLGTAFAENSSLVLRILALGVLVNSAAHIPYALIQAADRPDLAAKFHAAEFPLHVVVVWVLVARFGVAGAAVAWLLRVSVDAVLMFAGAARLCALSPRSLGREGTVQLAVALLLGAALALVAAGAPIPGWARFVLAALLVLSIPLAGWRHLLRDADRQRVRALLRAAGAR